VVAAAKKRKAHGLGVDLDPERVEDSNRNARKAGVTELVEFRQEDVMKTDVRRASVVTLFMLEKMNMRLRPKLFAELKPGTRVVSNSFSMRDWKPDKQLTHARAYTNVIYLWFIPAPVGGTWTWQGTLGGKEAGGSMQLEQEFQAVRGKAYLPGAADVSITEAKLAGRELSFTVLLPQASPPVQVAFRGTARGDEIRGTQQWRGGPLAGEYPWVAKRKPADVTGRWQIRAASRADWSATLRIDRAAGGLRAVFTGNAKPPKEQVLRGFYVWGSSVRFEVPTGGRTPLVFSGSLAGRTGGGTLRREQAHKRTAWTATRLAGT